MVEEPVHRSLPFSRDKRLGLLLIPVAIGLVTALGVALGRPLGSLSHIFLYLFVVIIAAVWWNFWLAFYAFILSLIFIDYYFIPPRGSLLGSREGYNYTSELVGLSVFLVLSVFVTYLVSALRRERDRAQALAKNERAAKETVVRAVRELEQQQRRVEYLQRSRQLLSETIEPEEVLPRILDELIALLGGKAVVVLESNSETETAENEVIGGSWLAGYDSNIVPEQALLASDRILPLRSGGQLLGRLGYTFNNTALVEHSTSTIEETLTALVSYIAISLENGQLYRTLEFQNKEIAQLLRNNLNTDTALSKRAEQLSIFYRLSATFMSGVNRDNLMILGLSEAGRVLSCSVGAVLLLTPERDKLELVARRGALNLAEGSSISLSEGWPAHIMETGRPFLSNQFEKESSRPRPVLGYSKVPIRSCLFVPIMSNSETFGVIVIASEEAGQYKSEDLDFLNGLAGLLALALVSTQFYAERERAAGNEERNRIARDLHDGLAQSINYIGLKTQLVQELYEAGENDAVLDEIKRISRAAELARMDVREVLYGLRHTGRDRSLTNVLADLVRSTADLSDIKVHLSVTPEQDWPALSLSAHIQLMRIVQEALSNIQKHSQAREAWVEAGYYAQPDRIKLRVADNGVGFEPAQAHSSASGSYHLGLGIMRERAVRSGADLKIVSHPGSGTEVLVEYKLNKRLGTAELAVSSSSAPT